ncbi:MAG: alpha/beta hydrolase [Lentisphaerae bacterium]|nr:alpha/beta hydrolase [Lentisphaerota bacterium]
MKKFLCFLLLFAGAALAAAGVNESVVNALPKYSKGRFADEFDRYDFQFDGTSALMVVPNKPDPAKPWIWRARFFGHQAQTDVWMLRRGYYLVYINVGNLYGNRQAVERWNKFYDFLTEKCGFSRRPVLEGMSRGGLIVFNWAKQNPDKCAAVYVDAPVCDIRSWPCRNENSKDSKRCLAAYGISRADLAGFRGNPIDDLQSMAKARIPVLAVCGVSDTVVPMKDNIVVFAARYQALGGKVRSVNKPGNQHHPHSLLDPSLIVNFLELYSRGSNDYAVSRGSLDVVKKLLASGSRKIVVGYAGGGDVKNYSGIDRALKYRQYPQYFGEGKGKADLYVVTCDRNNFPEADALEKLLQNIRKSSPAAGILLIYPGDEALVKEYIGTAVPINRNMITARVRHFDNRRPEFKANARIAAMEKLAEKYGCDSIDVSRDLAERKLHLEFSDSEFAKAAYKVANENAAAMLAK